MNQKMMKAAMMLLAVCFLFTACSNDDDKTERAIVNYNLTLDMPLDIEASALTNASAVFTNVQTKETFTFDNFKQTGKQYVGVFSLPEGTYNVEVKGDVTYTLNNKTLTSPVKATQTNVAVNKQAADAPIGSTLMALNVYNAASGFVISEIFFSGTMTRQGQQYLDDQYIKIANNSDTVMYADGLALVASAFQTIDKQNYTPDIMNNAVTVSDVFIIPGSGKEHPVQPGQEIVIALNARNHNEVNEGNSIDLSKADFQFNTSFSVEFEENGEDVEREYQNANVPLLVRLAGEGRFNFDRKGAYAYALARLGVANATYASDYTYEATYKFEYGGFVQDMTDTYWMMPNAWVLDAVNLSVKSDYQWNVTSPALDAGYTYCSEVSNDAGSYRKAVVRKKDGAKWQDTNNSTNDFETAATPSYFR